MPFSWKNPLKALPALLLLAVYAGAACGAAGNVQFVIGDVKRIDRAGVAQTLQKGAEINEGDRVVTADGASAQIKMADGGFIAVRPNTDMGFDTYRYSGKEDGSENAVVSLLRGGFRTITGIIGRTNKQNYMIKTTTATIGIRGTDHEPMVILAPLPGQVAVAPPGTYDKVNVGVAFIRTDAGSIDIQRNQVGFASDVKALPLVLPKMPPFYKPTPAPGPQKAKEDAKDEGKKEGGQTAGAAPEKSGEEQKAASGEIRNTAVVDPTSTVSAAAGLAPIAGGPMAVAPVVAITATDASGTTLNTTTQTQTTSSGTTTPISTIVDVGPLLAGTPGPAILTSYFSPASAQAGGFYQSWVRNFQPSATGYTSAFGTGSPNFVADNDLGNPTPQSETLTGGNPVQAPTNANSYATTGITFGRYTGGTLSGVDWQGNSFNYAPPSTYPGEYMWIKGPMAPLPTDALTGTAKYVYDGGTVAHRLACCNGSVNYADLVADFNKSAVGVDLSVTAGGTTWAATTGGAVGNPTPNVRMDGGHFYASSFNSYYPALHQSLSVTMNGSPGNTGGSIDGQLMGSGLSGAGLTYAFNDYSATALGGGGGGVNGAVAFALNSYNSVAATAIDLNVPYVIALRATGLWANPSANPAYAPASVDHEWLTRVMGHVVPASSVVIGAAGLPTTWYGQWPITVVPTNCPNCGAFVNTVPMQFSIDPASFGTGSGQVALPAGKIPATVQEFGFDAATGMSWGRYGGGVVAVFDRIGGIPAFAHDANNSHVILGPTQTGPTALPISGTYTYTNIGATRPTDNLANVGTLNAATLVADFAAQTVNAGVNLTVNGQTWAAGGSAIPIQERQYFEAGRSSSGGNMNICVGATCGTTTLPTANTANTSGKIAGIFNGSSGQGVGMGYSLNQGGGGSGPAFVPGTTVSGVAAFKR